MPGEPKEQPFPVGAVEFHAPTLVGLIQEAYRRTRGTRRACELMPGPDGSPILRDFDLTITGSWTHTNCGNPRMAICGRHVVLDDGDGQRSMNLSFVYRYESLSHPPQVSVRLTPPGSLLENLL